MRALDELCRLCGVESEYWDIWGKHHATPESSRLRILQALGFPAQTEDDAWNSLEQARNRLIRRQLAPVTVLREDRRPFLIELRFAKGTSDTKIEWQIVLEDGSQRSDSVQKSTLRFCHAATLYLRNNKEEVVDYYELLLPDDLPVGYHQISVCVGQEEQQGARLIIAPARCYEPEVVQNGRRVWGVATQLYGLRSQRNWGVGDFSDLRALIKSAAANGIALIGLSPLHALPLHNLEGASPYSPTSRFGINALFLVPEELPEYKEIERTNPQAIATWEQKKTTLRSSALVNYEQVAELKLAVMRQAFELFKQREVMTQSVRANEFVNFVTQGGKKLSQFALYQALARHFALQSAAYWGWPVWPQEFQKPDSPAVESFARENKEEIEFFLYLEWIAREQLVQTAAFAKAQGLGIGLYLDLALGPNSGGAETWAAQDDYSFGISMGAPPDDYSLKGQSWGLPPFNPLTLAEGGYQGFISILRSCLQGAGAIRIDHIMGIARLFWVPEGDSAEYGAYVRYPMNDLLGVIALESQRAQCMIVGEDLGTVPDELRTAMADRNVLSYKVLYFMKRSPDEFLASAEYPRQALVMASTHDLPTIRGFWQGKDIVHREQLELFPTSKMALQQHADRVADRKGLLNLLIQEGLLDQVNQLRNGSLPEMTDELVAKLQRFLARTPSAVMLVQLEDLLGEYEQANLPGTVTGHPNWQRKACKTLEQICEKNLVCVAAEQFVGIRG